MTNNRKNSRALALTVSIAYTILVTVLSLLPASSVDMGPEFIPHLDKIAHFLMYGGYVATLALACQLWGLIKGPQHIRFIFTAAALVSCYGILMEFMQAWLRPGDRAFSYGDMVANALGSLAFAMLIMHNLQVLRNVANKLERSRSS